MLASFRPRGLRPLVALVVNLVLVAACAHANDDGVGIGGAVGDVTAASGPTGESTSTGSSSSAASVTGAGSTSSTSAAESSSAADGSSSSSSSGGGPGDVFFSEYVEGTGNNKALEIVNTTATSFQLGDCQIDRYQNGSSTAAVPTVVLDTFSLQPGNVYVLCNAAFSQTTLCDQTDANVSHTGNDAVVLVCNGVVRDAFGVVGVDAVWGTSPTISQDATLRRKCSVHEGDPSTTDPFDPATEWDGFPIDTFAGLGTYGCP